MSYGKHKLKRRPRKSRKSHSKRSFGRVRRSSAIKKRAKRPVKRAVKKLWKRGGLKRKVDKEVRKVIDKDQDKGSLIMTFPVSVGAGLSVKSATNLTTPLRIPGTYGLLYNRSSTGVNGSELYFIPGTSVTFPLGGEIQYGASNTQFTYGNDFPNCQNGNVPLMFGSYSQVLDAASCLYNGKVYTPTSYQSDQATGSTHNLNINDNIHVVRHSIDFCLNWNSNIQGTIEMFIFTAKSNFNLSESPNGGSAASLITADPLSAWIQGNQEANRKCDAMEIGIKDLFAPHHKYSSVPPSVYKRYAVKKLSWPAHPGACYKHTIHNYKDKTFKAINYFGIPNTFYDITKGTKFVIFRCKAEPTVVANVNAGGSVTYASGYQTNHSAVNTVNGDNMSVGGMIGTIRESYTILAPASCDTAKKLNFKYLYDQTGAFERNGTFQSSNGTPAVIVNPSGSNVALNVGGTLATSIF